MQNHVLKSFTTFSRNILGPETYGTNIFQAEEIEKCNIFKTKQNYLWLLSPHCFEIYWIHFAAETRIPWNLQLQNWTSNIWISHRNIYLSFKTSLNLRIFGKFLASYICLYILLKSQKKSWDLRDLIYMALYFF